MAPSTAARPWFRQWTTFAPLLGLIVLVFTWGRDLPGVAEAVVALLLGAAVLAAVHHAEVVAHKVGEPFGSLLLAIAVTVIEVALIVTLMLSAGDKGATLARDTVFAAVMITCNGIVGLSVLLNARRRGLAHFNPEGSGGALAVVAALSTLSLVLPNYTRNPGPTFSASQLGFAAVASLVLYIAFVTTQTQTHRDFFLPVDKHGDVLDEDDHAEPPSTRVALTSLALLLVSLVVVVGLAKVESPAIEGVIAGLGLPHSFVGVVIALLVLAPETLAAANAARRGRLQTSFNLALGSAMASIGLTIPVMALATLFIATPLHLGLEPLHIVLLSLTLLVSVLTIVPGRATRLQATVHLVLLSAYLFLAASP